MNRHQKLGEILLQNRVISQAQLDRALEAKVGTRQRLGQVLASLGYATETQIARVLALQLGLPMVDLSQEEIDPEVLGMLTRAVVSQHNVVPIRVVDGTLHLAMADPLDLRAEDTVRDLLKMPVKPFVATESQVLDLIMQRYSPDDEAYDLLEHLIPESGEIAIATTDGPVDKAALLKASGFESVVKAVNALLSDAVKRLASDIHLEPFDQSIRLRYRIDGRLRHIAFLPVQAYPALVSRLKLLANLDITETRRPQDGSFRATISHRVMSCRVSTLRTGYGEKVVIRLLDNTMRKVGLDGLGLLPQDRSALEGLLAQPQGLVLVTGPTGSGKTTTLYAALNHIHSDELNIITIEDPIESQIHGVNQVQVDEGCNLTFARALRSILRQDPNVIMVGEVRDTETAEIAVRASLTGHLVLATLHTNDACSAPLRLIDMGVEPYLLGASLIGVLAQRLVRRLCPECSQSEGRPVGCRACGLSGYSGRVGLYELLSVDARVRDAMHTKAGPTALEKMARRSGFRTLQEDAAEKVSMGWTTHEQVALALGVPSWEVLSEASSQEVWQDTEPQEPALPGLLLPNFRKGNAA